MEGLKWSLGYLIGDIYCYENILAKFPVLKISCLLLFLFFSTFVSRNEQEFPKVK